MFKNTEEEEEEEEETRKEGSENGKKNKYERKGIGSKKIED